ncbi:cell cycle regulator of non-homologous end joining [Pelodytes ibericus]
MDEAESRLKKRVLPQWMTQETINRTAERGVKRTKVISPRKRTVHCMNERELVDYARKIISKSKIHLESEDEGVMQIHQEEKSEEPVTKPLHAVCRSRQTPPPPAKGFQTTAATSGAPSDSEDDPLKFVREIFFS